jgi:hypothetical protein
MPNTIDDLLDDMAQREYSQVKAEFEEIQRIVAGFEETSRFPQIDKALNALPKLSADMDYFTLRELKEKKFPQIREFVNEQLAYEESKRQQRRKLYNQIIAEFKEIKNLKAQLKGKPCDEYTRLLSALPKPFTQDTDYGVMWKVKEETFPQMKAVLKKQQDEETEEAQRRAEEERRRELYPQVKADFEEIQKLKAKLHRSWQYDGIPYNSDSELTRHLKKLPKSFPSLDSFIKDLPGYISDFSYIKGLLTKQLEQEKEEDREKTAKLCPIICAIIFGILGILGGGIYNAVFGGNLRIRDILSIGSVFVIPGVFIGGILGGGIGGIIGGGAGSIICGIDGALYMIGSSILYNYESETILARIIIAALCAILGGILNAIGGLIGKVARTPGSIVFSIIFLVVGGYFLVSTGVISKVISSETASNREQPQTQIPDSGGNSATSSSEAAERSAKPPQTAFSPTHRVATNDKTNLRLRSSPSTKGEAIMSLPNGSSVQVLQIGDSFVDVDGNAGNWTYVATPEGGKGWCFGAYLKALGN